MSTSSRARLPNGSASRWAPSRRGAITPCGPSRPPWISEASMADFGPHLEPHPDVAGYLLGTLEPDESERFASHLGDCEACQAELSELARIPDLLSDVPP